jgi:hypothetical protein
MRFQAHTIQHQHVETLQAVHRSIRDRFQIGRVGEIVKTIGDHGQLAVDDLKRCHGQIAAHGKRRAGMYRVGDQLRQPAADMRRHKNILENTVKVFPGDLVRIDAHRAIAEIQWADVVEAKNVIDVTMCNEDKIEAFDPGAQRLLAKIDGSIDQDRKPGVFYQNGSPEAFIFWIFGQAGLAFAGDRGDAG